MSIKKKFDDKLYSDNDQSAREAVLNYVSDAGLFVQENPDKYGPDLIAYKGFRPFYYIEVEIKRVWKNDFQWKTVQLPERKGKFLKLGKPIEFWILRSDLKQAIIIPDFIVEKSPLVEVPNKFIASGELFYIIDLSECDLINLEVDNANKQD